MRGEPGLRRAPQPKRLSGDPPIVVVVVRVVASWSAPSPRGQSWPVFRAASSRGGEQHSSSLLPFRSPSPPFSLPFEQRPIIRAAFLLPLPFHPPLSSLLPPLSSSSLLSPSSSLLHLSPPLTPPSLFSIFSVNLPSLFLYSPYFRLSKPHRTRKKKKSPQKGSIEDKKGGYQGSGVYALNGTRRMLVAANLVNYLSPSGGATFGQPLLLFIVFVVFLVVARWVGASGRNKLLGRLWNHAAPSQRRSQRGGPGLSAARGRAGF